MRWLNVCVGVSEMKKSETKNLEIFSKKVQGVEDWKQSGLGGDAQVVQLAPGSLTGDIFHVFLEDAAVSVCSINQSVCYRGPVVSDAVNFTACLNVDGNTTQRGVAVKSGDVAIYAGDGERDTLHSGGLYRYFCLAVPRQTLSAFLNIYSPEQLHLLKFTSVYQPEPDKAVLGLQRLEQIFATLQEVAAGNSEHFESKVFALSILSSFLTMLPDKGKRKDCSYLSSDRRLVQEVEELMRSDEGAFLCVPSLCEFLRVGRRTLERAFQRTLDVSPVQYLMLYRLCRAREDLVNNTGNVSTIAMKHGFCELGRFAQRYKQLFGEFPSETLAANSVSSGTLLAGGTGRLVAESLRRRLPRVA